MIINLIAFLDLSAKTRWVAELFESFARSFCGTEPYPLQSVVVVKFVRFCAKSAQYAHNTIHSVIIPSLKRLHCINQKCTEVPYEVHRALRNVYRFVKRQHPELAQIQSRAPCTTADLELIVNAIPPGDTGKPEQASCYLVSGQTGARVVTMANTKLGDILSVRRGSRLGPDGSQMLLVQLRYNVTKGNRNWRHVVCLEGQTSEESGRDAVFWLEKHLQSAFNLSLHSFSEWDLSDELRSAKLWRWNELAMSAAFKTACVLAGFEEALFSFHSLRAGFICSAIIAEALRNNSLSKEAQHAIEERTAYVAGWKAHGPAQQLYIKGAVKSKLIASRIAGAGPEGADPVQGDIDASLLTSEAFHGLKSAPKANYSIYRNLETLNKELSKIISANDDGKELPQAYREGRFYHCIHFAFRAYTMRRENLKDGVEEVALQYPSYSRKRHSDCVLRASVKIARDDIAKCLSASYFENFSPIFDELKADVLVARDEKPYRPYKTLQRLSKAETSVKYNSSIEAREFNPQGSRKRIPWSDEEIGLLLEGYALHGSIWSAIAPSIPRRSPADCRDKHRQLKKNKGENN